MPHQNRSRLASLIALSWMTLLGSACAPSEPGDEEVDGDEPTAEMDAAVGSGTVDQAVNNSCSTASVKPLSQQIIDEMRCLDANSLVEVPAMSNLQLSDAVFPYLEKPARDALVAALNAKPGTTLEVNSMFRTIAQQYMVRRWYEQGRCGIAAAATPGNSNHETGLAIDVQNYSTFRATLQNKGFRWFGNGDKPHFDYVGAGAESFKGLDVKAFQRLWNRNHPNDIISEDGAWGPQTRARLQKAPAGGFAVGATCNQDSTPVDSDPGPDPNQPASCEAFPSSSEFTCAPDGMSRGVCDGSQADVQPCSNGCLIQSGSDVCMGGSAGWSCGGVTAKKKLGNGNYLSTSFGCSISEDGSQLNDGADNCIPACIDELKASGACSANMTGKQCERAINWFSADRDRFGCGAKLRVTNPANGKSAVVMVVDAGPSCSVEQDAGTGVMDLSYRTTEYLFGGPVGWQDGSAVHVVEVGGDTPLGPN